MYVPQHLFSSSRRFFFRPGKTHGRRADVDRIYDLFFYLQQQMILKIKVRGGVPVKVHWLCSIMHLNRFKRIQVVRFSCHEPWNRFGTHSPYSHGVM